MHPPRCRQRWQSRPTRSERRKVRPSRPPALSSCVPLRPGAPEYRELRVDVAVERAALDPGRGSRHRGRRMASGGEFSADEFLAAAAHRVLGKSESPISRTRLPTRAFRADDEVSSRNSIGVSATRSEPSTGTATPISIRFRKVLPPLRIRLAIGLGERRVDQRAQLAANRHRSSRASTAS